MGWREAWRGQGGVERERERGGKLHTLAYVRECVCVCVCVCVCERECVCLVYLKRTSASV